MSDHMLTSFRICSEELEAYVQDGVLSHTGLAFSRDTEKKIYIQHKMNEDSDLLARMLDNGAFYLCGPTWPVPDVYEALTKAFMGQGKTQEEAEAHIEELKQDERYILEVYVSLGARESLRHANFVGPYSDWITIVGRARSRGGVAMIDWLSCFTEGSKRDSSSY